MLSTRTGDTLLNKKPYPIFKV